MSPCLRFVAPLAVFTSCILAPPLRADAPKPSRIAVIKADDVRRADAKWDRFINLSLERDVVVSLGLIGNSLEAENSAYATWLKKWHATGKVEFWNHGWDHKRWTDEAGKTLSEFGGSGYAHQKDHLSKTQAVSAPVFGKPFAAFGSPFNAMDPDTAKALNEIPELPLVFCYPDSKPGKQLQNKLLLPMHLRGEHDGTGKPNFAKFKEDYLKKDNPVLTFAAIQFHPAAFAEDGFNHYTDILDFLKTQGWTFVLPSQYLQMRSAEKAL